MKYDPLIFRLRVVNQSDSLTYEITHIGISKLVDKARSFNLTNIIVVIDKSRPRI